MVSRRADGLAPEMRSAVAHMTSSPAWSTGLQPPPHGGGPEDTDTMLLPVSLGRTSHPAVPVGKVSMEKTVTKSLVSLKFSA